MSGKPHDPLQRRLWVTLIVFCVLLVGVLVFMRALEGSTGEDDGASGSRSANGSQTSFAAA